MVDGKRRRRIEKEKINGEKNLYFVIVIVNKVKGKMDEIRLITFQFPICGWVECCEQMLVQCILYPNSTAHAK